MKSLVKRLRYVLGPRASSRALGLFLMMAVGAGFEALGIGLVLPFVALLSNPDTIAQYDALVWAQRVTGTTDPRQLLMYCGGALLAVYVVKNVYLYVMYFVQYTFVFNNQVRLMRRLLAAYLNSSYIFHVQRNSSELVRNLTNETSTVFNRLLVPLFTLIVEALVVVVIGALLLVVDPLVTLVAGLVLGGLSALFYRFVRARVLELGRTQQREAASMIKWINQGVGGLKEAKVLGREDYFTNQFHQNSATYAGASRNVNVMQIAPRFIIEIIGIGGMLAALLVIMARGEGLQAALPILSMFGIAAVRLMPSSTRLLGSLTVMRNATPALDVLYEDLEHLESAATAPGAEELPFEDAIELRDVTYMYPETTEPTIRALSLRIGRGESVAFVGPSGSGKTTTVDIVLGLLKPMSGQVLVDGTDIWDALPGWQKKIGYIAQPTYIMDESLRRNVAFGVPDDEIDDDRVWAALRGARLEDHARSLDQGLDTLVGEHGARFSGGQRQRIGIARALYHDPDVLVLDEATSALDNETERGITQTIAALKGGRTIITIAHRLSTIRDCDRLYFLDNGALVDEGRFDELVARSEAFRKMTKHGEREATA